MNENMITYSDRIKSMLLNIIDKTRVIHNNFESCGEVHPSYILEKLKSAEWDLKCLIKEAEEIE